MTILLTGDWSTFGKDDYFRKIEVYNMEWCTDINFDVEKLVSAPFGGLIAAIRHNKKIVKVHGSGKPVISIYTSSGIRRSSLLWNSGHIIELGWSSQSDLLCIREDGQVLSYDMFSKYKEDRSFSMGQEAQELKVKEAKIFRSALGTGIAILTSANRIHLANSITQVKVRPVAVVPGVDNAPTAWIVVCEERHSKVLFAKEKELYLLNENENQAISLSINMGDDNYIIKEMASNFTYTMLAVLNDRGKLWIGTVDVRKCMRLFDTNATAVDFRSVQLLWCGNDAVAINWGKDIELVGLVDENLHYNYDDSVFCVQEIDCIRVISFLSMDIIQKVPQAVRDIFKINSTSPGSYLLEASKQYQKKNYRANEYLHLVKPRLFKAVTQCIDAAGHEFNPETQKMLIKAAQFGKISLDDCNPESYITMIRVLRCLNALRHPKVGIPLTYSQLQALTMQGLMELLMIRRNYFLALSLASFLKMPDSSKIQLHWAFYKVKHSIHDADTVAKDIAEKIGNSKVISYRDIAWKAFECKKIDLAIKLLEYESRASLQIPLLLKLVKITEDTTPLRKAIESGNTDLVYQVLEHMKKNLGTDMFQMKIREFHLAQALYLKFCRAHNKSHMKNVYEQEDNFKALAECHVRDSFDPTNSGRDASLVRAKESYKKAKLDVNASFCDEQLKLLKHQRSLEDKFKRDFVGKSLQDTLKMLLKIEVKLADKLRMEYKVPDRRYWWLRIEELGESQRWAELEAFSKHKKSPIGYEPFLDVCCKQGEFWEAQKYLPKVQEEFKVQYLSKLGMFKEAAELAYNQRDLDALKSLQTKCSGNHADFITSYIRQLTK